MVSAYILILTEVGRAADGAAAVAEIPGVKAADDAAAPTDHAKTQYIVGRHEVGQVALIVAGCVA